MRKSTRRLVLTALLALMLCGCREEILHDLSEDQANRLLTKLYDAGFDVRKERQGDLRWSISTAPQSASAALAFLTRKRALPEVADSSERATSILNGREESAYLVERRISREIERTLLTVSGVLEARVHLNQMTRESFGRRGASAEEATASLLVVSDRPDSLRREELAAIVAGASGIPAGRIAVVVAADEQPASVLPSIERHIAYRVSAGQAGTIACVALALLLSFLGIRRRNRVQRLLLAKSNESELERAVA